jgi:hypothetical protein
MAALAALVLSGCFAFSGIKYSETKIAVGDKTVATVETIPSFTEPASDYVFFLIGLPDDGSVQSLSSGRKFDVKEKFGSAPRPLGVDTPLKNFVLANESCDPFTTANFPDHTFIVVRTPNPVNDRGKPGRKATSKLPFKQVDPAETTPAQVIVAPGFWSDDGDGVPEPAFSDFIGCTGGGASAVYVEPVTTPKRSDIQKMKEKYFGNN